MLDRLVVLVRENTQAMLELFAASLALLSATGGVAAAPDAENTGELIHPSTFTAAGAFPTSVYESYHGSPTATSAQVQPVVSDPVTVRGHC